MRNVIKIIAYTLLIVCVGLASGSFYLFFSTRQTARRIEAKLDTVLTINQRSTYEINQIRTQLDTLYHGISDAELLDRTKAINAGYRRPNQRKP